MAWLTNKQKIYSIQSTHIGQTNVYNFRDNAGVILYFSTTMEHRGDISGFGIQRQYLLVWSVHRGFGLFMGFVSQRTWGEKLEQEPSLWLWWLTESISVHVLAQDTWQTIHPEAPLEDFDSVKVKASEIKPLTLAALNSKQKIEGDDVFCVVVLWLWNRLLQVLWQAIYAHSLKVS